MASGLVRSHLLGVAALIACVQPAPVTGSGDDAVEAEWDVLPLVAEGAYLAGAFVEVTGAAYRSSVAPDRSIRVWVSRRDAGEFLRVSPEASGSGAELARGAVVVREVYAASGAMESLTVMARSHPGYSPGHGDWWFGLLDEEGWPRFDDLGEPMIGPQLERCASCHRPREADGFLFGVPGLHRDPGLVPGGAW